MPIERSAREVLFGTPVVSHQIQKYMAQRKACTITDLRADFYDISKALFFSTIFNLTSRSVLKRDEELVTYIGNPPSEIFGCKADRAWKAALHMDTFTSDRLAIIAELDQRYATTLCRSWAKSGAITEVGKKVNGSIHFKVYRVAKATQIRPRLIREGR